MENRLLFREFRAIDRPTLRKMGIAMDEKLLKAIEEFITQRMDDLGTDASDTVSDTIAQVGFRADRLEEVLTEEQLPLWRELEDALSLQTGEETRYYYRAGFHDAIQFLLRWDESA